MRLINLCICLTHTVQKTTLASFYYLSAAALLLTWKTVWVPANDWHFSQYTMHYGCLIVYTETTDEHKCVYKVNKSSVNYRDIISILIKTFKSEKVDMNSWRNCCGKVLLSHLYCVVRQSDNIHLIWDMYKVI